MSLLFETGDDITGSTLRGAVAEMVACVGPTAAKSMAVDLAV